MVTEVRQASQVSQVRRVYLVWMEPMDYLVSRGGEGIQEGMDQVASLAREEKMVCSFCFLSVC